MTWLNEETEKLDAYAEDLDAAANIQIKEKEAVIKAAKKALRSNTAMSLDDKIKEQRRIKAMDKEVDDLKMKTYERKRDIRAEADAKLDALANALKTVPTLTPVLTIRWEVPAMSHKQRLELTWIGKEKRPRLEPRILMEDPALSYHASTRVSDADVFDNRLIFGDNLLALKSLEQDYYG